MDQVALVPRLPQSDEEMEVLEQFERISGDGYNFANTFSCFHMPFTLISPLGTGVYADKVVQNAKHLSFTPLTGEVNGCTYTMIDPYGQARKMEVPGGEYDFELYPFEEINVDDYSYLIVSYSTLLTTMSALYPILLEFDGRIALQIDTPDFFYDEELLQEILALHPILQIRPQALFSKEEMEQIDERLLTLTKQTKQPILKVLEDGRCQAITEEETLSYGEVVLHRKDISGYEEVHFASYILAKNAGMKEENALLFAQDIAKEVLLTYDTSLDLKESARYQDLLAKAIMDLPKGVVS